jgi:hypothetical protein
VRAHDLDARPRDPRGLREDCRHAGAAGRAP